MSWVTETLGAGKTGPAAVRASLTWPTVLRSMPTKLVRVGTLDDEIMNNQNVKQSNAAQNDTEIEITKRTKIRIKTMPALARTTLHHQY